MRADLGANREQLEALEGGVERLAEQVAAGRAESEARAAELLAELAAVREVAEQAGAGVAELRDRARGDARGDRRGARSRPSWPTPSPRRRAPPPSSAKLEEEKVEALQAEVQFAHLHDGGDEGRASTSAGQAALVARREAEQAKKAAEHAGDGTGEHVSAVFREILGLAAKGRPRTLQKAVGRRRRRSRASRATASTTRPSRWP